MIKIEVHNAQSRLHASSGVIRQVRPLVAYRDQNLPPAAVQHVINHFMRGKRRWGMVDDHRRIFDDIEARQKLEDLGWGSSRLTPQMFEGVMRMRGVWDGWKSLVSTGGMFGTGLLQHVQRALTLRLHFDVEIDDQRAQPAWQSCGIAEPSLYDYQAEAVDAWVAAGGRGVIDLPPRSGKTRIAVAIAARLGLPMLMVVPRVELVRQTAARFREYFDASDVVEVTGGRPSAKLRRRMNHALVWIATPPTAAGPKPKSKRAQRPGIDGIRSRKVLVIDEFHHSAADTWQAISDAATEAYYRLGLTGTHFRADGKDMAMHAVLSRAVYSRTVAEMVEMGRLAPAKIAMVRVAGDVAGVSGYDLYTAGVTEHPYRNGLIKVAAQWLMHFGKRVLVLTKEVEHSEVLAEMIGPKAQQVDGSTSEDIRKYLNQLAEHEIGCVVGTSVIGEGVDVPAADALIYAVGGKSPVKHKQDYFRVLTATDDKNHGMVLDFADVHHPKLEKAAAHRLGTYRSEGDVFQARVIDANNMVDWIKREV